MKARVKILALSVVAALAGTAFAQDVAAPVAAPVTPAVAAPAMPAVAAQTTPAVPAPATTTTVAAPAHAKVLVIPFNTLNLTSDQKWIAKGVEAALVSDLGKSDKYAPAEYEGQQIVEDNATAIGLAKEAGVPFALSGTAQVVNGEVRLTSQLIDAKTGDTVSTAISTGPLNNMLKMEDDVAIQLHLVAVPVQTVAVTPAAPQTPTSLSPAYATPQPTYTAAQPVYTPAPAYTPPPDYPVEPVYPPVPFNDLSLSAQNYNAYPAYSYPVYTSPIYCYPYSGVYLGGGYIHYPARRVYSGGGGIHVGGSVNVGGGRGGFSGGHGGFSGGHGGGGRR